MTNSNRVYEEWESILVKSHHGTDIYYRVFNGTVNWNKTSEGMRPALTVLMQYGSTENWEEAKSRGEIDFSMPAHILSEDLSKVLKAIQSLSKNG